MEYSGRVVVQLTKSARVGLLTIATEEGGGGGMGQPAKNLRGELSGVICGVTPMSRIFAVISSGEK